MNFLFTCTHIESPKMFKSTYKPLKPKELIHHNVHQVTASHEKFSLILFLKTTHSTWTIQTNANHTVITQYFEIVKPCLYKEDIFTFTLRYIHFYSYELLWNSTHVRSHFNSFTDDADYLGRSFYRILLLFLFCFDRDMFYFDRLD